MIDKKPENKKLSELEWLKSEGISVIPLNPNGNKKPIIDWKEFQERKPTQEEITSWIPETKNFAAVCGAVSGNLTIIDIDNAELFEKLNLGEAAARTKTDKTPHGYHIWLRTETARNNTNLEYEGTKEIEIKSDKALVTIAGSKNEDGGKYEHFLTSPREIATVQDGFFSDLENRYNDYRLPGKKGFGVLPKGLKLKGGGIKKIINTFAGELKELKECGDNLTCRCPFPTHEDKNPSFTIYPASNSYYCFGCEKGGNVISFVSDFLGVSKKNAREKLKSQGWIEERKDKKEANGEEETLITTSMVEKDGTLYEEIFKDGVVSFIDRNGNTYETLEVDGLIHVPTYGDDLTEGAVLLPSGVEPYEDEKMLITDIRSHIHRYIEVSPFFETIAAYYVLLSWLYDELNTLPYLRVLGDTGTGKSRFLDTVGRLCYKATSVSGAITPAPIYRLIRRWHGTIIIDEADFRASDEQNEVVKILNSGFERGRPVIRSQKDNPDDLQILPTFSPKIIATRKRFKDVALESRCLTEITKETDRDDIPYLLPSAFYTEEASLRNKLLSFRFRNHGLVDTEKAQMLKGIDVENRIKQAVSSFIVLFANNKEVYNEFTGFLTDYNRELVEERADTFEGAIVNAIFDLVKQKEEVKEQTKFPSVPPGNVQNGINGRFTNEYLKGVRITATDITELLKENYGLGSVTSRGVGRRLKTLGITSTKKGEGVDRGRYLDLEERALAKLIKKYIPISVDEMPINAVMDVTRGYGEDKKENGDNMRANCEMCGTFAILSEYWLDNKKHMICAECIKAQKETEKNARERLEAEHAKNEKIEDENGNREKTTVEEEKKDGSTRPPAFDSEFQRKQSRESRINMEKDGILPVRSNGDAQ